MPEYKNPFPTVDIVILDGRNHVVLIKRKNPPHGWAIPGGFVDQGEAYHLAAIREAKEETNLDVELVEQFHTYSDPSRDPRSHTASTVYIARVQNFDFLKAQDDAADVRVEPLYYASVRNDLAFDHRMILSHVNFYLEYGLRPKL